MTMLSPFSLAMLLMIQFSLIPWSLKKLIRPLYLIMLLFLSGLI
jgi:hypothetical protein